MRSEKARRVDQVERMLGGHGCKVCRENGGIVMRVVDDDADASSQGEPGRCPHCGGPACVIMIDPEDEGL